MPESQHPPNQFSVQQNNNITRVTIPNFVSPDANQPTRAAEDLVSDNTDRIDAVQQAIGISIDGNPSADNSNEANLGVASTPSERTDKSARSTPSKIDGLIDSILAKFPLSHPVTLVFVGSSADTETDTVTADVAQRLSERYVGKVLLVDANPNSQTLSKDLGFGNLEGIGNFICDEQPWQPLLQSAQVDGLDCLPYGNVSTAKTLRSRTQAFLTDAKMDYQFICVSVGRNESPLSKSFCNAADGIYLLVDLVHLTHLEAKAAADRILQNNLPLVGCIALDAEQDQQ